MLAIDLWRETLGMMYSKGRVSRAVRLALAAAAMLGLATLYIAVLHIQAGHSGSAHQAGGGDPLLDLLSMPRFSLAHKDASRPPSPLSATSMPPAGKTRSSAMAAPSLATTGGHRAAAHTAAAARLRHHAWRRLLPARSIPRFSADDTQTPAWAAAPATPSRPATDLTIQRPADARTVHLQHSDVYLPDVLAAAYRTTQLALLARSRETFLRARGASKLGAATPARSALIKATAEAGASSISAAAASAWALAAAWTRAAWHSLASQGAASAASPDDAASGAALRWVSLTVPHRLDNGDVIRLRLPTHAHARVGADGGLLRGADAAGSAAIDARSARYWLVQFSGLPTDEEKTEVSRG